MTAIDNNAKRVIENSIHLVIAFSRLWVQRSVDSDQVEVDADKTMVATMKMLIDSPELRKITLLDYETRRWLQARALPSPLYRKGVYLLPTAMLEEVYPYLEQQKKDRNKLIQEFIDVYPEKVKEAKKRLKGLFNAKDYPASAELKRAFAMEWNLFDWSTPEAKLKSVKGVYEKERAKAEKEWASATDAIRDALRVGMSQLVSLMVERLTGGDDGKPKRIKEKSLTGITEFLDTFDKRNLTGDTELAALAKKAKALLNGVDAKTIRDDDKTQKQVTKGFEELKGALDKMVEIKPKRHISLEDEVA